jgi:hypothetical protein
MSQATLVTPAAGLHARAQGRDKFFLSMSGALLLILLIGFSPTLYLRLFFDVPPIPFYLHVHGATVTAWFVWLVVQASLVNVNRVDVHQRIGMAGAVLGAAVVPAGLMATLQVVGRLPELGLELEGAIYFISWVIWVNFHMLLGFVGFLAVALLLRRRTDIHKRLMLLASISLIPPALARISSWFGWVLEQEIIVVTIAWLLLLIPMFVHDLIVDKRVHKATALGGLCFVLIVLAPAAIATTEFAQEFVRGLG